MTFPGYRSWTYVRLLTQTARGRMSPQPQSIVNSFQRLVQVHRLRAKFAEPSELRLLIDCIDSKKWGRRPVATLTIRDFDDELKAALRVRAAQHGR